MYDLGHVTWLCFCFLNSTWQQNSYKWCCHYGTTSRHRPLSSVCTSILPTLCRWPAALCLQESVLGLHVSKVQDRCSATWRAHSGWGAVYLNHLAECEWGSSFTLMWSSLALAWWFQPQWVRKEAHFATGILEHELRIRNSGHASRADGTKQWAWCLLCFAHFRLYSLCGLKKKVGCVCVCVNCPCLLVGDLG